VGLQDSTLASHPPLRPSPSADGRLAASTMPGPPRRAVQAEMALPYCGGPPLRADTLFGWGRPTVAVGLAERRTGLRCLGAPAAGRGRTPWEDTPPAAAAALGRLADAHAPPAPTCRSTLASTRLTAPAALETWRAPGSGGDPWPAPRTMAAGRNRMGLRRRTVVKAQPPKQMAETDAIVDHREKKPHKRRHRSGANVCAAMVKRPCRSGLGHGGASREALTRQVLTTWVCKKSPSQVGLGRKSVATATAPVAAPTRRVMASSMRWSPGGQRGMRPRKGPWHGCRSTWLMARKAVGGGHNFCIAWWRSARPLASRGSSCLPPPAHSQYNPMERCWGILAWPWNGTKGVDMEPRVEWAKRMTGQGRHPLVALSRQGYQKGVALSKRAMRVVEDRLERHPELPQWDILIHPVSLP
jgi:hypothetical protein